MSDVTPPSKDAPADDGFSQCIAVLPGAQVPENWAWVPVAYHGRASSVVISGTPVRRPAGQLKAETGATFAPCEKLDYEVEYKTVKDD